MTVADTPKLWTSEDLDALPDDGIERWIINGQLREGGMTKRSRGHSRVELKLGYLLHQWLQTQPAPRGELIGGEAGVRLRDDPETNVGVDVAYLDAATAQANPNEEGFVRGVPVLVAEILSPSDKHEAVTEKVDTYLACGVKLVWVVDPAFRTITVYRSDAEPQLFNVTHTIDAEPHLPGFRAAVADVFSR